MASERPVQLFLTCEHGGNLIPPECTELFRGCDRLLQSHRGWDPGALQLAGRLAVLLRVPLRFGLVSRLVVDLNRSRNNPDVFSSLTDSCTNRQRKELLERHYRPYRDNVIESMAERTRAARVVHVSVHSFTPVLRGKRRTVDIGLLFDPDRPLEARFVAEWERELRAACPRLSIRRNAPYRGTDDGLTTSLRRRFSKSRYAGIELEINQRLVRRGGASWSRLMDTIADTLDTALAATGTR